MPGGEGLPVQVKGARQSRFTGAFAATVLVDDHAAEGLDTRGQPDGVIDWEDEFPRLVGCLVAHPVVRGFGGGEDVVGGLLGKGGRSEGEKSEGEQAHGVDWDLAGIYKGSQQREGKLEEGRRVCAREDLGRGGR